MWGNIRAGIRCIKESQSQEIIIHPAKPDVLP